MDPFAYVLNNWYSFLPIMNSVHTSQMARLRANDLKRRGKLELTDFTRIRHELAVQKRILVDIQRQCNKRKMTDKQKSSASSIYPGSDISDRATYVQEDCDLGYSSEGVSPMRATASGEKRRRMW